MTSFRTKLNLAVLSTQMAAVLFFASGCAGKAGKGQVGGPGANNGQVGEYPVMTVTTSSVHVEDRYPATLKGKLDVEIRPQVSGQIVRLAVDEGARVRRGQTLFVIDQVQFQEQVNAARAAVRVAETSVATAQLTVDNNRLLADKNVIGAYAMQTSENALATAQAQLAQAKAQLVSAQKNLSFTNISSPTDGIVGSIPFRVGSLVSPSMAQPLTTVSDISEMYAYISLTERQLLALSHDGASVNDAIGKMPPVSLELLDGSLYPEKGTVSTISGVINPTTGSVDVRVLFPNPARTLLSGSSGTVIIPTVIANGILIPQSAVYQIQERSFVYTVDASNVAHSVEVTITDANDGKNYVVSSGLKAGDVIVTDGLITLKDGATISIAKGGEKTATPSTASTDE